MTQLTLRIVDGPNRGDVFENITLPISIGREDGNVVKLNDEQVSRYHIKIFEESGYILVADLDSTNGTRINGENLQIWTLRPGDLIQVGKTVILVGTREEIAARLKTLKNQGKNPRAVQMGTESSALPLLNEVFSPPIPYNDDAMSSLFLDDKIYEGLTLDDVKSIKSLFPPQLPDAMSPIQTAKVSELLFYLHLRIRPIIENAKAGKSIQKLLASESEKKSERGKSARNVGKKLGALLPDEAMDDSFVPMIIQPDDWQNLLDVYSLLGLYLKKMVNPDD